MNSIKNINKTPIRSNILTLKDEKGQEDFLNEISFKNWKSQKTDLLKSGFKNFWTKRKVELGFFQQDRAFIFRACDSLSRIFTAAKKVAKCAAAAAAALCSFQEIKVSHNMFAGHETKSR